MPILLSALLLFIGQTLRADYLPNNFWPNAAFESGTNLNAIDGSGTPAGWARSGSDATICQVTTSNSISPSHSVLVVDNDPNNYGEWDSDVSLVGRASPGDSIQIQYYEMYSVADGEMRVTVLFFDSNGTLLTQNHYTVTGDSTGWAGTIDSSTFTKQVQTLAVPSGAVKLRISIVSGGSTTTTGVLVVDDLSVARVPKPILLAGNFWPNATFESGTNLDSPTNTLDGWNRGGSATSICQVATNNYVSGTHALMVRDTDANNYGEWYSDLALTGLAGPGTVVNLQWFELYSVTNGEMRVTVLFLDSKDVTLTQNHFTTTGHSAGWQGAVEGSGFTKRNQPLVVPPGGVKMRVSLVSGGPTATTGVMLVDDFSAALPPQPALLAGNFWPNPTFETGSNLNRTNGVPSSWAASGDDSTICQVTTNNYTSATHALVVVDGNTNGYGEWDADLLLSTNAAPDDLLDIQYSELYSVTNGEMRVTALFYDSGSNVLGKADFTVSGQSAGWQGSLAASSFVLQKHQVLVPANAVRLRISLVSGGPGSTTGIMAIDDLSVARHPVPPSVLAGNFFPNPTFEDGAALDDPVLALPAGGWQRGGSSTAIDQMTTNNWVSPTHSLALVDNDAANYGEWYLFTDISTLVTDGAAVDIQWYQMFSTTNGGMRLSFAFLDSGNNTLFSQDFGVTGDSPGWNGSVAASTFDKQTQRLTVPPGTTQLRVNFASGGSSSVVGIMLVDDLSVRLSRPYLTSIEQQAGGFNLTWNTMLTKTYTVLFSPTLGPTAVWTPVVTGLLSGGLTTSYLDTTTRTTSGGFWRVVQE